MNILMYFVPYVHSFRWFSHSRNALGQQEIGIALKEDPQQMNGNLFYCIYFIQNEFVWIGYWALFLKHASVASQSCKTLNTGMSQTRKSLSS